MRPFIGSERRSPSAGSLVVLFVFFGVAYAIVPEVLARMAEPNTMEAELLHAVGAWLLLTLLLATMPINREPLRRWRMRLGRMPIGLVGSLPVALIAELLRITYERLVS